MKKLLSIVIVLLLTVSGTVLPSSAAETEISDYDYKADYDVYYKPIPEAISLYFNGAKLENPPCEEYGYVQYTSVADALGYETSFDSETRTVTSTKNEFVITFQIDAYEARVMEYDSEKTVELYNPATIFIDKTYIGYYDIGELFGYLVTYSYDDNYNTRVDIIDTEIFRQPLIDAFKLTEEYAVKLPDGEFSLTSDVGFEVLAQSKYLGLTLEGATNMNLTLKKSADSYYLKLLADNSGIFNIYNLMLGLMPHQASEEAYKDIDFNAPVEIEVLADKNGVYLKSDAVVPVIVASYMEYDFESSEIVSEIAKSKGKWITLLKNDITGEIEKILDAYTSNSAENLADTVLKSIKGSSSYGVTYDSINKTVNSISALLSGQHYKVTEKNGKKIVTMTIDAQTYREYFKNIFNSEFNNLDWLWNAFEISGNSTAIYGSDSLEYGNSTASMGIPKIPNKFGFNFGGFEITVTETDKITSGKQTLPGISTTYELPEYDKYPDYYEEQDFEI